jgi:hypothetical protein
LFFISIFGSDTHAMSLKRLKKKELKVHGRLEKEAEFMVKFDEIFGKLQRTEDPTILTFRGVDIFNRDFGGEMECTLCGFTKTAHNGVTQVCVTKLMREHITRKHGTIDTFLP